MSDPDSPPPPLLLRKRITAFLAANLSPEIHSVLLTTLTGKLLAYASPYPASLLRTQGAAAASLAGLPVHISSSQQSPVPTTLPQPIALTPTTVPTVTAAVTKFSSSASSDCSSDSLSSLRIDCDAEYDAEHTTVSSPLTSPLLPLLVLPSIGSETTSASRPATPVSLPCITVWLSDSLVIIRRLHCGLLLVCVGPPSPSSLAPVDALPSHPTVVSASDPPSQSFIPTVTTPDGAAPADPDGARPDGPVTCTDPVSVVTSTGSFVPSRTPSIGPPTPPQLAPESAPADDPDEPVAADPAPASQAPSASGGTAAAMRRHVDELAQWLDDKLQTLRIPDESLEAS